MYKLGQLEKQDLQTWPACHRPCYASRTLSSKRLRAGRRRILGYELERRSCCCQCRVSRGSIWEWGQDNHRGRTVEQCYMWCTLHTRLDVHPMLTTIQGSLEWWQRWERQSNFAKVLAFVPLLGNRRCSSNQCPEIADMWSCYWSLRKRTHRSVCQGSRIEERTNRPCQ